MKNKLLITGGSGLLGAYLVRWFSQQGNTDITATFHSSEAFIPADIRFAARWKKLSLPDKAASWDLVAGHEHVIHAAGHVSYFKKDRYTMLGINQTGTEHIVNACLIHGVSHLVYIGSIGALGRELDHVTVSESTPWLQNEFSTSYGLSKYLGELEVWRGGAEGLPVSVIMPSVILGSGNWHRSSLQMIDRIVHKLPFYPGGQTGFVDVRDVARFISLLLDRSMTGERWLISGASLSYGQVYRRIASHLGLKKNFRPAPKWLARAILLGNGLLKGGSMGVDVLNQAYGTFTYDNVKSLSMEGFQYRDMDQTFQDVAMAYKAGGEGSVLHY